MSPSSPTNPSGEAHKRVYLCPQISHIFLLQLNIPSHTASERSPRLPIHISLYKSLPYTMRITSFEHAVDFFLQANSLKKEDESLNDLSYLHRSEDACP
ncbi:hypothetical protein TNCV_4135621 [Trichonephila clavipes]|nr:hypothetical protein TNCV_4135621 [Trichonephila clavipes]